MLSPKVDQMPPFVHGLELNREFFRQAVRPILEREFPGLDYAAALVGTGSDVLGFDDEMSTDHEWGPSLRLLLRDQDSHLAGGIREALAQLLPLTFLGFPVGTVPAAGEPNTRLMQATTERPLYHRVYVTTVRAMALKNLGYDIDEPVTPDDWLTFPSQKLREITGGAVYEDRLGELAALRERLAWYPAGVWLYLLASGWRRIAQEEHLMPRAGFVGDELGSAIIGSRLVRDIMGLAFLIERQYAPYPKWFGTAFKQLACANDLLPHLWRAQMASTWPDREAALGQAYEYLARAHNALGITDALAATVSPFHNRPFHIIHGDQFAERIAARIEDASIRDIIARHGLIGNIDQWSDSTDIRSNAAFRPAALTLYA
jgi:hypothetical protein